jgi:hypothetical protein
VDKTSARERLVSAWRRFFGSNATRWRMREIAMLCNSRSNATIVRFATNMFPREIFSRCGTSATSAAGKRNFRQRKSSSPSKNFCTGRSWHVIELQKTAASVRQARFGSASLHDSCRCLDCAPRLSACAPRVPQAPSKIGRLETWHSDRVPPLSPRASCRTTASFRQHAVASRSAICVVLDRRTARLRLARLA